MSSLCPSLSSMVRLNEPSLLVTVCVIDVVITGQVTDETTSPIIGAVVKLVNETTSITQTVTNNEGSFNLTMEESDGHKELIITYMGYADYRVSLENTQRNTDLGKIQLTPSTQVS